MSFNLNLEGVMYEEDYVEQNKPQGGSTEDYWVGVNPLYLSLTRPELSETREDIMSPHLDAQDPTFLAMMADSDVETQEELLKARGNEHAIKVFQARNIRQDSLNKIANDSLGVQLAMGIVPAIASPTNLVPAGAIVGNAYKAAKAASLISGAGRVAVAGAVSGAVANVGDEALFDMQGLQTDYVGATTMGLLFGGGAGFVGGMLGAVGKARNAEQMHITSDTLATDLARDPDMVAVPDANGGTPRIEVADQGTAGVAQTLSAKGSTSTQRQHNLLLDNPLLNWLNSDVIKVYGSQYNSARTLMSKLVAPTTSLRDANGNPIALGITGDEFKQQRTGVWSQTNRKVLKAFTEARKEGYRGNEEAFVKEVSEVYHRAANQQELGANTALEMELNKFDNNYGDVVDQYTNFELKKAMEKGEAAPELDPLTILEKAEAHRIKQRNQLERKVKDEFYNSDTGKFTHDSPAIVKGAEAYKGFFNNHLEMNQKLNMKGIRSTNKNKLYAPKTIDFNNFKEDAEFQTQFKNDVRTALINHPGNRDLTPDEIEAITNDYVNTISDVRFKQNFTHDSFLASDLIGSARLKERKFRFDESIMGKYRTTNLGELAGNYSYQMTGRQAVMFATGKEAHNIGEVMTELREGMMSEHGKVDEKVIEQVRDTIRDLAGTLRMNALSGESGWRLTRGVTAFQSARLGSTFGGNQLIEAVGSVFMSGMTPLMSGRMGKSFKASASLLYKGDKDADDFANLLLDSGLLQDALMNERINRTADIELGLNPGGVEKALHGFNSTMYKYNGLRYIKSVMEDFVGAGTMREIKLLAKKDSISNTEARRLARWGLTHDTAKALGSELDEAFTLGKLDLSRMSAAGRDQMQLAIQRAVSETVIQGDTMHLPNFMKVPSKFRTLVTQFLRFPMIAQNVMLRRGLQEEQARMVAGSMAMVFTAMGLKYLREQASVSLGYTEEWNTKYDYFSNNKRLRDEARERGAIYAANYTAPLGMLATLTSMGSGQITGNDLLSDYKGVPQMDQLFGPSYSMIKDIGAVAQDALGENKMTDRQTAAKIRSMLPILGIPVLKEGTDAAIKELF